MEKFILDAKDKVNPEYYFSNISTEEIRVKSDIKNRDRLVWACIIIIVGSVSASYYIIFAVGYGKMQNLPDSFLHWIGAATIGTIISNILIVYKSFFPSQINSEKKFKKDN